MMKVISSLIAIGSLGGGLLFIDSRYEHSAKAADTHQQIEQRANAKSEQGSKDSARQLLEMRLELYRLKVDYLRSLKHPSDDDKDDLAYYRSAISTIRAQLEGLDK